ncbi:hypothetical protein [Spirosoma sp.]|uniref:hypothetical protein n=1 Tax=Spirosoma sp. TaxID=1899569 RepID=UPI00262E69F6|nr:hypothetical protein [Spirosoma sp.]MCX6213770.1 hypothetical protein [Spirosoma sp.]
MGKVTLPPLPGVEPKGSIATYLSQVRQKRTDDASSSNDHGGEATSIVEDQSFTELLDSPINSPVKAGSTTPVELQGQSFGPIAVNNSADRRNEELSKILDNSPSEPKRVNNAGKKDTASPMSVDKEAVEQRQMTPKRSRIRTDVVSSTPLPIVKLINSLPNRFAAGYFTKGESKVRLTAEMADLIQIIVDSNGRIEQPKYFADNLVNYLLKEFFIKYASDIEQLSIEQQERQRIQHQKNLTLIKQTENNLT